MFIDYMDSMVGCLEICADDHAITAIFFVSEKQPARGNELTKQCMMQLSEYFEGKRIDFDLPLAPKGTPFQKRVWNALCDIPYGETRSYKQIAIACGNEKACRAVGMSNNRNPIPIIIPCHRVIGANGKLVGYGGGLDVKIKLLDIEKR